MLLHNSSQISSCQSSGILSRPIPFTLRRPITIRCPHPTQAAATRAAAANTMNDQVKPATSDAPVQTSSTPSPDKQERGLGFTLEGETETGNRAGHV